MSAASLLQLNAFSRFHELIVLPRIRHLPIDSQIHLVWTLTGLLIVQPNKRDYLYMNKHSGKDDVNIVTDRVNGDYAWTSFFEYADTNFETMKQINDIFTDDINRFVDMSNAFGTYDTFIKSFDDKAKRRLNREIKFLLTGLFIFGCGAEKSLYRLLLIDISASDLLFRPFCSQSQLTWLKTNVHNLNAFSTDVVKHGDKVYSMVSGISVYGRFMLRFRPTVMVRRTDIVEDDASRADVRFERIEVDKDAKFEVRVFKNLTLNERSDIVVEFGSNEPQNVMLSRAKAAVMIAQGTSPFKHGVAVANDEANNGVATDGQVSNNANRGNKGLTWSQDNS